jgi:hypothetical protein
MKMIIAGVALAALMATPAFAQPPRSQEAPALGIHLKQKKQLRADYRDLYLSTAKPAQPATDVNLMEQEQSLCSTAHDFCPGFHGDNG